MPILLVILAVLLTVSLVYIRGLRQAFKVLSQQSVDYTHRAIESERRAASAETELAYMKLTLQNVLQRPAVVAMSEENMQHLAGLIESVMAPERMN
jgi:hypothetical protein